MLNGLSGGIEILLLFIRRKGLQEKSRKMQHRFLTREQKLSRGHFCFTRGNGKGRGLGGGKRKKEGKETGVGRRTRDSQRVK